MRLYTLDEFPHTRDLDGQLITTDLHPIPPGTIITIKLRGRHGLLVSTTSVGGEDISIPPVEIPYCEEVFCQILSYDSDPHHTRYTVRILSYLDRSASQKTTKPKTHDSTAHKLSESAAMPSTDAAIVWHHAASRRDVRAQYEVTPAIRSDMLAEQLYSLCEERGVRFRKSHLAKKLTKLEITEEEYAALYKEYKTARSALKEELKASNKVPSVGQVLNDCVDVYAGGTVALSRFLKPGDEITCKPKNVNFIVSCELQDQDLLKHIQAAKPYVFEPLAQTHVTDWGGRILPPSSRFRIQPGNTVRVCVEVSHAQVGGPGRNANSGAYYMLVVKLLEGNVLLGKVLDTYIMDVEQQPVVAGDGFIQFDRSHINEIPLTWQGNENLLDLEKHACAWGFSMTGWRKE